MPGPKIESIAMTVMKSNSLRKLDMLQDQGAITVIVPIRPGHELKLHELLMTIGDRVDQPGCPIDFGKLTTIHFMRWVMLPECRNGSGNAVPAQLALSTNYDLPRERHLRELIEVGGAVMREIYSHCEKYERNGDLYHYLTRREFNYSPNAFYVGTKGLGVGMIRKEMFLREEIEKFIDQSVTTRPPGDDVARTAADSKSLRASIQDFVRSRGDLCWASESAGVRLWKFKYYAKALPFVLVVILPLLAFLATCVLLPMLTSAPWYAFPASVIGLVFILVYLFLRKLRAEEAKPDEQGDDIKTGTATMGKIATLVQREDHLVQNQLTHLVDVKPGWFRLATLWTVLAIINFFARFYYVRGLLGPIPTIHFARWVIIDRGKRLLFFSNYDGSWVNYLGDFIDKAAIGLTAIWSNTAGSPKAHGLIHGGATDEQRFKSWTRDHQIFTQVWYSAYEDLTVDNIMNSHKLRMGLFDNFTAAEERDWLSLL